MDPLDLLFSPGLVLRGTERDLLPTPSIHQLGTDTINIVISQMEEGMALKIRAFNQTKHLTLPQSLN